jgi:hypothetical protein
MRTNPSLKKLKPLMKPRKWTLPNRMAKPRLRATKNAANATAMAMANAKVAVAAVAGVVEAAAVATANSPVRMVLNVVRRARTPVKLVLSLVRPKTRTPSTISLPWTVLKVKLRIAATTTTQPNRMATQNVPSAKLAATKNVLDGVAVLAEAVDVDAVVNAVIVRNVRTRPPQSHKPTRMSQAIRASQANRLNGQSVPRVLSVPSARNGLTALTVVNAVSGETGADEVVAATARTVRAVNLPLPNWWLRHQPPRSRFPISSLNQNPGSGSRHNRRFKPPPHHARRAGGTSVHRNNPHISIGAGLKPAPIASKTDRTRSFEI